MWAIPGRTWGFFHWGLKYARGIRAMRMKSFGTRGLIYIKNLHLYGWFLHFPYHNAKASSASEQFSIWIVWLFGAVWAFSHMAVLLGTQAKFIAYVGRVWQEFSEYVFLRCTHTQTPTHREIAFVWTICFWQFMNNECMCVNLHTQWHANTHFPSLWALHVPSHTRNPTNKHRH